MESIFAARREILMGLLFRGVEGIAQLPSCPCITRRYEECFIQDMGMLMNTTPMLPDRIISIPWLVFHYEGVSLAQMLYERPKETKDGKDTDTMGIIVKPSVRTMVP